MEFHPSPNQTTKATMVAIAVCAVALLVVGLLVAANRDESAPTSQYALAEPVPMPPLVLTDTAGLPFDLRERAAGRVTLLYLGYVNCPDVCPITTGVLSQTMASMPADVRATVQVVFVTVDPTRDSPDQIRSFLDQFDESFIGLTATPDQLEQLQVAMSAPSAVSEPADADGGYLVGHVTSVFVFEQDGVARSRYPFGTRQAEWANVLPKLVRD